MLSSIATYHRIISERYDKYRIMNDRLKKLFQIAVFFVSLQVFYSYVGVYKYIGNRPSSIHMSAQCQRASIALNYYRTDMNFFKPKIQRYIKGEGITGVEFPIIYYSAAIMYKLFGFNELYLRSISLILFSLGIFCFYLMADKFIKNSVISFMMVIAASLSPVLLFYTPNFMPDAPSMGLQLMSWYFFFRYVNSNKNTHLNLFVFIGVMAALIKAISAMVFIVVICLVVLDKLKLFKTDQKNYFFDAPLKVVARITLGFVSIIAWYAYASWLSVHYEYESFALKPLMVDDWNVAKEIFVTIKNLWVNHYFAKEAYIVFGIAIAFVLILAKYANRVLFSITILYLLGSACYVYLFMYQFKWHDYYIIAILPLVFFTMLTFGEMITRFARNYVLPLQAIFIIAMFFNLKESAKLCKKNYNERYSRDIYYWTGDYRAYEDLEPKLRKAGIQRTDKFVSGYDDTYCSSLYLMDQIGVNFGAESSIQDIDAYIKDPAIKYLVLNDSARLNKVYPNDLANKVFLTHRGLIIYKLR